MTIGPVASPVLPEDARLASVRPAAVEPATPETPAASDDMMQVDAFRTLVGDGYRVMVSPQQGGIPQVVIPGPRPSERPVVNSTTTRLVVGGAFAGAMGGAFVAASLASLPPAVGVGIFLGSTVLGAAAGFLAGRGAPPAT